MREVAIIGIGQVQIEKKSALSLRQLGTRAAQLALADAQVDSVDALYVGNMLADELSGQKHVAALIASEAGLAGIEALHVRAATAAGAGALRVGVLAVGSGLVDTALILGVELMSAGRPPTNVMALALDGEKEVPLGETLLSINARLMHSYLTRYGVRYEDFANFAVNAHRNASGNPVALLREPVTVQQVLTSRFIIEPLRLFDCAPICDGAAALVLAPLNRFKGRHRIARIAASTVATDHLAVTDRADPLALEAARLAARRAFAQAGLQPRDIDFFELHDAFSIMACLQLEACGFAERGQGWRLAAEGEIFREGWLPIATRGGLKARGHPIGASALYQVSEIAQQLWGEAGENQLDRARIALTQSVGGAAATLITHIITAVGS